jgi:hypothetical protein
MTASPLWRSRRIVVAVARRANEVNPPGAQGWVNEAAGLAGRPGGGNLALQGFGSARG